MSATPNRASQPPAGKPKKSKDVQFDLATARRMLPLVRGIVADIVDSHTKLDRLVPESEKLERDRRALDWAARQRRYAMTDEIAQAERALGAAQSELAGLGVTLADPARGLVDFPTRINSRPAAFSWQHGEGSVGHWRYAGEEHRRHIPADWQGGGPVRSRAEP
jgi:hypothetical protein